FLKRIRLRAPSMESQFLKSGFLPPPPSIGPPKSYKPKKSPSSTILCCLKPDPWTLSTGNSENLDKPKPKSKNAKNPLSDDNARRIIKAKARYLSVLRRNQGSQVQTPKWIKRTPEQMVKYLEDDRNGHLYGRHVVAAIKRVRGTSVLRRGQYNMREEMSSFVAKLSFRDMCVVLKEQKNWRAVSDFFGWMKLQVIFFPSLCFSYASMVSMCLSYRPSVIVYTIVLRAYGQVGKLKLAEETFLEMLEVGCQPDEVACGTMLCAYAKWGRHKAMLSFYSAVEERGIVVSPSVFNFMLSSLQKKSLHRDVLNVWRKMVDKRVAPNHFTYTVVVNSLVKGGMNEEAMKVFNEMKNLGFVPEESTYSLLISSITKEGNKDGALRLYEEMRSHGIVPSNFTCASLLALYCRTDNYAQALSLFSEMEKYGVVADEVIHGLLIRMYGKLGLYEDAEKTFAEISRSARLSDEKTYTTMAEVHLNQGNYDKALAVMEQMKSGNIQCSGFSHHLLLQCYISKGDLAKVEAAYEALSMSGSVDSISFKVLLGFYQRVGLSEKAKTVVAHIRKSRIELDEELFMKVMTTYCREGMLREVEQLLVDLSTDEKFGLLPCIQACVVVINGNVDRLTEFELLSESSHQSCTLALELVLTLFLATLDEATTKPKLELFLGTRIGEAVANAMVVKFAKEGNVKYAELLYEMMLKLGRGISDSARASMIKSFGKEKKMERARELFRSVDSRDSGHAAAYSSMIFASLACGRENEAFSLYKEQAENGRNLDAVFISRLVKALVTSGKKYSDAEEVIRICFRKNMELDAVGYNTCINAMLEAGRLHFAVRIFERMRSFGVTPTVQTYNTMIRSVVSYVSPFYGGINSIVNVCSVYGRNRNLDKAVEMFEMAGSSDEALDEKIYTNMISQYGKAGKGKEALTLVGKMLGDGIRIGQVGYNIIMNAYAANGMHEEVEKLLVAMRDSGFSPDSLTYLAAIRSYARVGKAAEAEGVLSRMRDEEGVVVVPSRAHYQLVLSAYAKAGSMGDAGRMYREIGGGDGESSRRMLRGYLECGDVEGGMEFLERDCCLEMIKGDEFSCRAAARIYASGGKMAAAEEILGYFKLKEEGSGKFRNVPRNCALGEAII
ncbi:hypothetical protein M569_08684, partial [Genlisea aurea]